LVAGRTKIVQYEEVLRSAAPARPPADPAALFPPTSEGDERHELALAKLAFYQLLLRTGRLLSLLGALLLSLGVLRVWVRAPRRARPARIDFPAPGAYKANKFAQRSGGRPDAGELEAVVGRGRPGRRRDEAGSSTAVQSLVELLVRALGLERAALLVEKPPQGALVPVVVHGDPPPASLAPGEAPGAGAWSLALPVGAGEGARGLLLLGRAGGAPLTPAERALAAGVADALVQLVESERQAAELRHTRELLG